MIDQKSPCDDEVLLRMLRQDSETCVRAELLDHVEGCTRCQHRLDELAAHESEWQKTVEVLSSNARDAATGDDALNRPHFQIQPHAWTESMAQQLLSPPSHPEMLGRIGRYDVERLIGSGGMGVVFKAHDTELNRPVAVKLLAPYLAASGSARNRFAREARAAAAVVDDHVVPIHNVETDDEHPFLVMKYIAGGSLQQRIDREGPLDVCEVLRIGMQTAKGLAAAHAQGLIHRDVKPSNILLDEGVDRALLTDFGLARATDDASLTRSGFHPGTPHYMSPEQVRGEAIDARSDLFGLGCVLYAICTGHPPFRSETSYAVLRRITDDTPRPIRETNPDVPEWLEQTVMKLLAKSPNDRFDSAEQVAELLEDCLAHVQQPTTTPLPAGVQALAAQTQPPFTSTPKNRLKTTLQQIPPTVKLIGAAAFAFSLIFAGVLIVLELNKGTLTIASEVDDVPIRIMQGEKTVKQLTITKGKTSTRIAAGEYIVEIDGDVDGIHVDAGAVSLTRGRVEIVNIVMTPEDFGSELGELEEFEEMGGIAEQGGAEELAQAEEPAPELTPSQQAFSDLEAEYSKLATAYHEASEAAVDEVELNRVYEEMDPRHIMPPKYLAMEEKYRGTDEGLKALVEVCGMARSVAGANSGAGKGRREAVKRVIEHYLHREGLESMVASLGGGPFVPQADGLLQALVEKSPFRKTQAEAMIEQIVVGKETLKLESQLARVRAAVQDRLAQAPPPLRREFEQRLKTLEETDFKQLRRDLNKKLERLAELYSDVTVQHYGTGGTAAHRLSHAINKVIIGQSAPELAGTDIDGKPFRLSELRGKHVVLMFAQSVGDDYGDMYAPMRQLVAKYKHAPVRVVGVMSNVDQAHLHAAAKRGDLNWIVIPQPLGGPLHLDWGIEGYQMVYIVDAEGTLQPPVHMPYYGEGGYDTKEVAVALDELLKKRHDEGTKKPANKNARSSSISQFPEHWGGGPRGYTVKLDTEVKHTGRSSVSLMRTSKTEHPRFGTIVQAVSTRDYAGKRIRYSGFIKSRDVKSAGLWLRVDSVERGTVGFDNMQRRSIKGTNDWNEFEIVLDVADDASIMTFGALLSGPGTIWIDDLAIEEVDDNVETTVDRMRPMKQTIDVPSELSDVPQNMDFED